MGLINDIWWFTGVLLALKPTLVGVRTVESGDPVAAAGWFLLALVALLLPEYVRWRLLGGSSVLERIPLVELDSG